MERLPKSRIDIGLQRNLEGSVRVAGAEKICVTYEEALFIVICVNEPTSYAIDILAANSSGTWVVNVHAINTYLYLASLRVLTFGWKHVNIWLSKHDKQVPFTRTT